MKTPLSKKRIIFISVISLLLALTLVFVWGNSLKPPSESQNQSGEAFSSVKTALSKVFGEDFSQTLFDNIGERSFRKLAHVAEYSLLAIELNLLFFSVFGIKPLNSLFSFLSAIFVSVTDELLQLVVGRNGTVTDVLLDLSPVLIICLVFLAVYSVYLKKHENKRME